MAFRMQSAVPELADLSKEPASIFERYGPESKKPGTYAANCILARRLAERGVRFIQLYHRGWDQHNNLPSGIKSQCHDTDQPTAALLAELKERGMLDDTLVIWGGEFGRTVYSQGVLTPDNHGRDHHPRCYSIWMAGAGVKKGHVFGETDDFSYNIVKDPVHIHDLNATALHLLGIDHSASPTASRAAIIGSRTFMVKSSTECSHDECGSPVHVGSSPSPRRLLGPRAVANARAGCCRLVHKAGAKRRCASSREGAAGDPALHEWRRESDGHLGLQTRC
jgi:hypothetical protein